jgi:hypothetical protein
MARKRCRKPGNLVQLRAVLWQTIVEMETLLDTRPPSMEVILKSAHALSQLAAAYTRLVETADLERWLATLEAAMTAGRSA